MASSEDPWLTTFGAAERLGQEIMDKISQYHQELSRNTSKAPSLATSIRTLMKKLTSNTAALKASLVRASTQGTITVREAERRQALIDDLVTTEKRLEQAFTAKSTAANNRSSLLGATGTYGTSSGAPFNPWLAGEETEATRGVDSGVIRSQHTQILAEQDRGLDVLSKIVGRQRDIAVDISAEVDIHNDILGEISEELERADTRLARETRNIKVVLRKSKTHWCLWVLVILLLISILVVSVVPAGK